MKCKRLQIVQPSTWPSSWLWGFHDLVLKLEYNERLSGPWQRKEKRVQTSGQGSKSALCEDGETEESVAIALLFVVFSSLPSGFCPWLWHISKDMS